MIDRIPPHNLEAEQSVLGAILLENKSIKKILDILNPNDFYKDAHKKIFNTMQFLHSRKDAIDTVSVMDTLSKEGQLESIGGGSYLSRLMDFIPTSGEIKTHAKIVKEKSQRRTIMRAALKVLNEIDNAEVGALRAQLKSSIKETNEKTEIIPSFKISQEVKNYIEEVAKKPDHVTGIPTGFKKIDFLTGGFQSTDLIVLAGRPGMGKSALKGNIAVNASTAGYPVGLFELEMDLKQTGIRFLSDISNIPLWNLRHGIINKFNEDYESAVAEFAELPIYCCFESSMSLEKIMSYVEVMVEEYKVKLIAIDYLQLITPSVRGRAREAEVAEISRVLKSMAKEFNVPFLCLAQLNRSCEARENKRPLLSDLRESGAIEQDADVVIFLYRDDYYYQNSSHAGITECRFAKGRHIGTGTIKLQWQPDCTSFRDLDEEKTALLKNKNQRG